MRKHPSRWMAVLAVLTLILAACSDDSGASPSSGGEESQPAESGASQPAESEAPTGLAPRPLVPGMFATAALRQKH